MYVYGQEHTKRALEIACAGGHNCRLTGPPGAGKTLLARALPSILPRLAHRGILFLDELPELGSRNLETLRQPLEDRVVTISRASGSLTFPANFILVAAMNPCPCGWYGDDRKGYSCSMGFVQRYRSPKAPHHLVR